MLFISSVWMILWPVRQMGHILVDMGKAFVAIQRIREVLGEPAEDLRPRGLKAPLSGKVQFKGVSFWFLDELYG